MSRSRWPFFFFLFLSQPLHSRSFLFSSFLKKRMIRLAKANPSMDERNPSTIKGVAQSAARRDMQTDDLLSASRLLRHGDGDNRCHERTGQPDKAAAKRSHLILI